MGLLTMRDLAGFGDEPSSRRRTPLLDQGVDVDVVSQLMREARSAPLPPILLESDRAPGLRPDQGSDTSSWFQRFETRGFAEDPRLQTPGVSRRSTEAVGPGRPLSPDEYSRLKRQDPELLRDWFQSGRYSPPASLWREQSGGTSPGMESRAQQQEAWARGTSVARTFTDPLPGVDFEQAAVLAADRARAAADSAVDPQLRARSLEEAQAYDQEARRLASGGAPRSSVPAKRAVRWEATTSGQDAEIQQREMERRGGRVVRPPGWQAQADRDYRLAEQQRQEDDRRSAHETRRRQAADAVEREAARRSREVAWQPTTERPRQPSPAPSPGFWDTLTSAGRATSEIASTRASTTGTASRVAAEKQRLERQRQRFEAARAAADAATARAAQAEAAVQRMRDVAAGRAAAVTVDPQPAIRLEQYERAQREARESEAADRRYQERWEADRAARDARDRAAAQTRREREAERDAREAAAAEYLNRAEAEHSRLRAQQLQQDAVQAARYDFSTMVAPTPAPTQTSAALGPCPFAAQGQVSTPQGACAGGLQAGVNLQKRFFNLAGLFGGFGAQQRRDLHMGAF